MLVHGAAGGIGIAAIQVAKLFGAKVIATASTEEKRSACLEEGADHAIDYQGGFIDKVKELTGGRGVDIAYDPIGAQVTDDSLRCLAWCGRLLILGFLGGGPTNIRSNYLLIKGIDAIGVRIGGLNEADPDLAIANMKALAELAARGQAEAAHLAPLPAGAGSRSDAGGDRPQGDRQGRAGFRLTPIVIARSGATKQSPASWRSHLAGVSPIATLLASTPGPSRQIPVTPIAPRRERPRRAPALPAMRKPL